ncbi:arylsulfatase [Labilibacter sediminis]|nr:arylsulfatase [Labilibacter sediminis]
MNYHIQLLLIINTLCSGYAYSKGQQENTSTKPNIVIIYADDMGYGDVSCQNNNAKLNTPNIDRLASEGIRFTDGHSSSGICSPSRFALLTGQYHWRRMHSIVNSFGNSRFKEGEFTIARMLKQQGYTTACIGKWHLGWNWEFNSKPTGVDKKNRKYYKASDLITDRSIKGGPCDQGFDYYFGDGTINFPPYAWVENDHFLEAPTVDLDLSNKVAPKEGSWEFRKGPMVKGWDPYEVLPTLALKAEQYIAQQKGNKPFFLYFALPAPHAPIIPNKEFIGTSEAGAYGDFVVQTDDIAGRVLKALEQAGLSENTLVIFTADNGPEKFAYNRILNFKHRSSGHLRGLKRDTWEGGHRVPFIIKWPGNIKPSSINNEVISQTDIAATIAAICGYSLGLNEAPDSYNLLPLLKNEEYSTPFREATIQNTSKDRFTIRVGHWVLIDNHSGEHTKAPDWYNKLEGYQKYPKTNPGLLYDLSKDPSQKNNLFNQFPEKVEEMRALLNKYRTGGKSVKR